ncbi:CGNR zinc finger domain-containing protein [Rhizobium sp. S152]|uniref:CGNR zinc finger domain-containing protein n=1 Tax=Rhizobium sp. S152 TaxID=3055038 RepID=UPI0025A99768|nr:CGNR zinc finger domain-containing protein [Rhizobium sp. S152]MDM9629234.1 CGNR zinc finger domain-containing protein [Rhizobium sp. S152]
MTFSWTAHRFSGGALALDVANSVILRHDDALRVDRFAVRENWEAFPAAAAKFCAERALFGGMIAPTANSKEGLITLREATDRYFRKRVLSGSDDLLLADLLEAVAGTLRQPEAAGAIGHATAHSALRLVSMPEPERMKICGNCGWLFLDRSKNRSRAWCDMAVCGNRAKANRHYRRRKEEEAP